MAKSLKLGGQTLLVVSEAEAAAVSAALRDRMEKHAVGDLGHLSPNRASAEQRSLKSVRAALRTAK